MKLSVVPSPPRWYDNGLDFTCTTCGNCCTGGPGYVWVTEEEIRLAAEHLKLPLLDFKKKYCRKIGGKVSFKEVRRPEGGLHDCIFLKELPANSNGRELEPGQPIPSGIL